MSLSFVKSAVLSSTDGISHNEETIIDNRETQSLRASGAGGHKPLFEQLRANKDADQERDEEYQKSLRGMRPLDEEDCAHLDAVERRRLEHEQAMRSGVEWEVAMFRAAKKDRELVQTVVEEEGEWTQGDADNIIASSGVKKKLVGEDGATKETPEGSQPIATSGKSSNNSSSSSIMTRIVPKFTIKRKRKRVPHKSSSATCATDGAMQNADARATNDEDSHSAKTCITGVEAGTGDETKISTAIAANNDSEDEKEDPGGLLGLGFYASDSDGQ